MRMSKVNKDNNPNGVFSDVGGVRYSKADGTWVPARRIEDGWHLFDELWSKLYFEYSMKNVYQLSDNKHADYNKKHKRGIRRGVWDPGIKKKDLGITLRARSYLVSQLVKQVIGGANISLLLYILKEQAHAKKGALSRHNLNRVISCCE
ncbi:hypothetical protein Tco_1014042 [Tanacetum coccineum]